MFSNIVMLDIGGTIFKTSKTTLTKYDGMLKTMLETSVPISQHESDAIFIDRSPKHFDKILNFLRDGEVNLPSSEDEIDEIRKEAQYYLLMDLVEFCDNPPKGMGKQRPPMRVKHLKGCEDIAEALVNCHKKGLILVSYRTDSEFAGALRMANVMKQHGENYDIYFTTQHHRSIPKDPERWEYNLFFTDCNSKLKYFGELGRLSEDLVCFDNLRRELRNLDELPAPPKADDNLRPLVP
ncbi:unnamed protein product [Caenorhabditis brenneri]